MAKTSSKLKKHTVNLFEGDLERLEDLYPNVDKGVALRQILRAHIKQIDARVQRVPLDLEVDLPEEQPA